MFIASLAFLAIQTRNFGDLQQVPFTDVTVQDRFWTPRMETNRKSTIEHSLAMLEKAGNFTDLTLAANGAKSGYKGLIFTDSDLYKVLEGISYSLATHPDPALSKRVDTIIAMIGKAQQPDGYINTWHQVNTPGVEFANLRDEHELYCAGHMIEAAVAHYQATNKRNFLDIALKMAELINQKFGPDGKIGYPGHPELELALVKLWKATDDRKWLTLSERLIDKRGTKFFASEHKTPLANYDGTYWLDDVPIRDHTEIKGHAVRAAYLLSGAADIAEETHDEELENMLGKVWRNATEKRIFVTGGIGPSASNEGFTVDYDLPNMTAYQETCASVAMALWGERMSRLNGDAQYEDTVEKALYNGMLSGVGLDGKSFFYTNPLASQGNHHRVEWFECACCPPNVLRTVASIGGFAYAKSKDALFVNLYMGGRVGTKVGSQSANWEVKTDYPWSGRVEMTAKASGVYDLMLRKPGWCPSASLSVNDKPVMGDAVQGYLQAGKVWKAGDKVVFDMQMPVQQVQANPMVKDDVNKSAIQRGPLIYCMEQVGNSAKVTDTILPLGTSFTTKFDPKLLGGVVAIQATGMQSASAEWNRDLYQPAPSATPVSVQLVPYGFWDNRGAGAMAVWMPTTPPTPRITGPEGKATVGMSFTSGNSQPWAINDGLEVKSSGEQPEALCHWWPHKGGSEWVSYTWKKPIWVSGSRLFWFDDTGRGECRLPESFKLQTLRGTDWVDVPCETKVAMNQWSELKFEPIQTSSLRILLNQQKDWASGIHEWKVIPFEK